jgi:2-iminobutanoate/2-iminopropanoate deaminase
MSSQPVHQESRRSFFETAVLAAVGGTALGVAAGPLRADEPSTDRRIVPGSPYPTFSRAVVFRDIAFVAGVLGQKPGTRDLASTDFVPQARQALENLKASVEAAGSSMGRVLKCNCFLTDAADFAEFNRIYVTFFPSEPPARSTVIVKALVVPDAKIEIDCVAAVG